MRALASIRFSLCDGATCDNPRHSTHQTPKLALSPPPFRPRTTITVSVLAGLITLSYIIRGMAGVVFKFVQTALGKRSIVNSFEAAADEVVKNEGRVMRVVDNVDDCEM